MQSILNRLIEKISAADIEQQPDHNFYIEDVFDPTVYEELLTKLPSDQEYIFIDHPDAILPDGTRTRKLLSLTDQAIQSLSPEKHDFWHMMNAVLTSRALQQTLVFKFYQRLCERFGNRMPPMANVPIFYRDFPGYFIGVHTDAPFKVITMQFYFPKDDSQIHLGTSFHVRENNQFKLLKTNPFKPNSAYGFVRTECSWHSVMQLAAQEKQRDTLALTIYLADHEEYERVKDLNNSGGYI